MYHMQIEYKLTTVFVLLDGFIVFDNHYALTVGIGGGFINTG